MEALYELIISDVSEIDKADLCADLARVYERMGNTTEAENWYDKGISFEQIYCRFEVTEKKAQYLSQQGRNDEAVKLYKPLMKQPFVSESEKSVCARWFKVFWENPWVVGNKSHIFQGGKLSWDTVSLG